MCFNRGVCEASAGGIFHLQGISGPDVTLMSCSKLRSSGAGQSTVVRVYSQVGYMVEFYALILSIQVLVWNATLFNSIFPFSPYCDQMHQHCIIWVSYVFSAKAPTFKAWPWLASVLYLFIDGELCALLILQAEGEHIWRRKVLLKRSF